MRGCRNVDEQVVFRVISVGAIVIWVVNFDNPLVVGQSFQTNYAVQLFYLERLDRYFLICFEIFKHLFNFWTAKLLVSEFNFETGSGLVVQFQASESQLFFYSDVFQIRFEVVDLVEIFKQPEYFVALFVLRLLEWSYFVTYEWQPLQPVQLSQCFNFIVFHFRILLKLLVLHICPVFHSFIIFLMTHMLDRSVQVGHYFWCEFHCVVFLMMIFQLFLFEIDWDILRMAQSFIYIVFNQSGRLNFARHIQVEYFLTVSSFSM